MLWKADRKCKNDPLFLWNRGFETVEKPLTGFSDNRLQFDPCIICAPTVHKFHTLKLICIFAEVHASVKNDFNFICRCGGKLCEASLTS